MQPRQQQRGAAAASRRGSVAAAAGTATYGAEWTTPQDSYVTVVRVRFVVG